MSDAPVETTNSLRRPDLPSLTSLRAFAAAFVFVYHVFLYHLVPFRGFAVLYAGVSFFFVLSGFILTWSHVRTQTAGGFYFRRFARIYPSHFVIWVLLLFAPIAEFPNTAVRVISSGLLVQTWFPDQSVTYAMNGVTWSLGCEAFFYLLFPLLMPALFRLSLRAAWIATGGLFVVATVFVLWASTRQGDWATVALSNPVVRLPEFLLGIVAARTCIGGHRVRWWVWPVVVAVAVGGLALFVRKPAADVWATPVTVVLILSAAGWDTRRVVGWLRSPALVYAGRISFAFYLVHELVVLNTFRLLGAGVLPTLVAFAGACVLAVGLHHLVEVPSNRALVRWSSGRRTARVRRSV